MVILSIFLAGLQDGELACGPNRALNERDIMIEVVLNDRLGKKVSLGGGSWGHGANISMHGYRYRYIGVLMPCPEPHPVLFRSA